MKPISPKSTVAGENQFTETIYLLLADNGHILPLDKKKRRLATHKLIICVEYPQHFEEVKVKMDNTNFIEKHGVYHIYYPAIEEWRVQRCLVSWNVHEIFSGRYTQLQRLGNNVLDHKSFQQFLILPPLIRKAIMLVINDALGHV